MVALPFLFYYGVVVCITIGMASSFGSCFFDWLVWFAFLVANQPVFVWIAT
jgi:hypothetical protein